MIPVPIQPIVFIGACILILKIYLKNDVVFVCYVDDPNLPCSYDITHIVLLKETEVIPL